MISFTCQKCGKQYQLKPDFAGRDTSCSGCQAPLRVPSTEPAETVAHEDKARIPFSCAKCGMKFNVLAEFAGRKTVCPTCKEALVVPSPDETVAYVPPAGQIDGLPSSLARARINGGVTLGGGAAGKSSLQELMQGKPGDGARYVIEKELARGGMGTVLRAVDCDIRREVAVKFLLDQSNVKSKIRFVEEAQITGQLEHPNIVPIHELGIDSHKRIFFTMKMVKGRSLAQIVKMLRSQPADAAKEYTLSRLLNILVNVCNALAYAHSHGVVHRDLKPANIMVGDFGEVYVMDWGLAKVLDKSTSMDTGPPMAIPVAPFAVSVGDGVVPLAPPAAPLASPVETPPSSGSGGATHFSGTGKVVTSRDADDDLTQAGDVLGTPVYMPPEQATGQIHNIDERSDIYSMGAILYELLTLQQPIDRAGGFRQIVLRVSAGQIEAPAKKAPERARAGKIPVELAAVAMKALEKNREDRYQTIELLRKDIELFLEGRSVSARQDTFREMARKLVKRNKGASIATAAALVALTVIAGVFLKINYSARVLAETERGKAEVAQNQAEEAYQAYQQQVKGSVPLLLRAAKAALADRQYDDALAQASAAANTALDNADARLLKGQLLITRMRFAEAAAELNEYRKLKGEDADFQKLAELCRTAQPEDVNARLAFVEVFTQRGELALADGVMSGEGKTVLEARQRLLEIHRKRIETAWPSQGNNLKMSKGKEGRYSIRLTKVADLTPLRGMPFTSLDLLQNDQIRDLTPLKGMRLTWLRIGGAQVRDLEPLKGMPLTYLNLDFCIHVRDLEPLKGMPLKVLRISGTGVTDLTPLQGMELEEISLTPKNITQGLDILRDMDSLKTIGIGRGQFSWPAAEFWDRYDKGEFKK